MFGPQRARCGRILLRVAILMVLGKGVVGRSIHTNLLPEANLDNWPLGYLTLSQNSGDLNLAPALVRYPSRSTLAMETGMLPITRRVAGISLPSPSLSDKGFCEKRGID